jgi:hypothetical protein
MIGLVFCFASNTVPPSTTDIAHLATVFCFRIVGGPHRVKVGFQLVKQDKIEAILQISHCHSCYGKH